MSIREHDLSAATQSAVIRMALSRAVPARIAMKGRSMAPLLCEGMVLEVAQASAAPRAGDIAVFESEARLVAHRVIRANGDWLVCSGDAQPDCVERVKVRNVVGIVAAVRDAGGRRIDTPLFWLSGRVRARLHALSAFCVRVLPAFRQRTYAKLADVMSAVLRGDEFDLRKAISVAPPWRMAAFARRHRCAGALCAALERISGDEYAIALQSRLRAQRWSAYVRTPRLRSQLNDVLSVLRASGIESVLLKGAERLSTGSKGAELFDSSDIDLLVPPQQVEAACDALRALGYRERCGAELLEYYRTEHHHAAPLYPTGEGVPIEIHRSLAVQPLNGPTQWNELQPYVMTLDGPNGRVSILNAVGGALHLAMHALQRPALREIVLLAQRLRMLDELERTHLRSLLERETRFYVSLSAPVAFAARMAGITWPVNARVDRFVQWMLHREDLPRPLRARTECVDAYLSASQRPLVAAVCASWSEGLDPAGRKLCRAAARLAAGGAIAIYLQFMR